MALAWVRNIFKPHSRRKKLKRGRHIMVNIKTLNFHHGEKLVQLLHEKNLKIATAESCTGGLISKMITDVSGASSVFECGICSYSDRIKENLLNVHRSTLEKYSAVSSQVAIEMAENVRKISNADIGLSTTGYAGPSATSKNEKVGLVYIGISTEKFSKAIKLNIKTKYLNSTRNNIRKIASAKAILLVIRTAKNFSIL